MIVELIEKFNMSIGTVFVIKSKAPLKIGDEIIINEEKHKIKSFVFPCGVFDPALISVVV